MRPEFLILPILAFSALFFVNLKKSRNSQLENLKICNFALLALLGAFLAKGSNPPFGKVYLWLFDNLPGMSLFRDSSKFYTLVALSYSLLIPFTISKIYKRLEKKGYLSKIFLFFVTCYLLFLVKPALLGQLGGTFKAKNVPEEYLVFKDFIHGQKKSFQVLWVPRWQRFGFSSNRHRAVSAANYIEDNKCLEPFCSLKIEKYNREYFDCHPNERCFPADVSFLANREVLPVLAEFSIK